MAVRPEYRYFSGAEADMLTFYRVPKILIKDEYFKDMSSHAKLLYGLCLDKMSLSVKNGWIDGENRAFIYYSREQIMDDLSISKNTAKAAIEQLVEYGLLEIQRQGLGKSDTLYLKNFVIENDAARVNKYTYRGSETDLVEAPEGQFLTPNNNKSKTITLSVNHNNSNLISSNRDTMRLDTSRQHDIEKQIRSNIELDHLLTCYPHQHEQILGIYDLIVETMMIVDGKILIASAWYPVDIVKQKFMKLNGGHIEYVLEGLSNNDTKVRNIKKYLLASLFNAPSTIDSYYQAEVNHDFGARAKKAMGFN